MKEKRKYESPLMERTMVELEDGFCAASANVENGPKQAGIKEHQVNADFTFDYTSSETTDTWD